MKSIRLLLVALAFTLVAVITTVPADPAQAGHTGELCYPLYDDRGRIVDWICVPIYIERSRPEPDPCRCPDWYIDISRELILPINERYEYLKTTAEGLRVVAQAAQTKDPRVADELRKEALGHFVHAAEVLRGERVSLGEVGVVDAERNEYGPSPQPWLESAGGHLVEGLSLVQAGIASPQPDPWFDAAMAEFDRAYAELAG